MISIPVGVIEIFSHNFPGKLRTCPGLYSKCFIFNFTANGCVLTSNDASTVSKQEAFTACVFKA